MRNPSKQPRRPRKPSLRSLENAALHHLQRYATTEAGLQRVLRRKLDRARRAHGELPAEAERWVDEVVARLVRSGLLDDGAYAAMKARSLRAGGRSARMISHALRSKGVKPTLLAQAVAEVTGEVSEADAARTWARRRRLGPFRRSELEQRTHRMRDMAALVRAGFSYQVARAVIALPSP